MSAALVLLAVVMNNEWSNLLVVLGLVMFGLGQGALATLLFNVLVTYAPKEFAGDVGSLRGTIKNLAAGRRHGGRRRACRGNSHMSTSSAAWWTIPPFRPT